MSGNSLTSALFMKLKRIVEDIYFMARERKRFYNSIEIKERKIFEREIARV